MVVVRDSTNNHLSTEYHYVALSELYTVDFRLVSYLFSYS